MKVKEQECKPGERAMRSHRRTNRGEIWIQDASISL